MRVSCVIAFNERKSCLATVLLFTHWVMSLKWVISFEKRKKLLRLQVCLPIETLVVDMNIGS